MFTLPSRQAAAAEASTSAPRTTSRVPTYGRRTSVACNASGSASREVTLLDYGAGNVRSVRNAIKKLGYTIRDVEKPSDLATADKLVFPGVGSYGQAMRILNQKGLVGPLKDYIASGRPFLGICLGLQLLFEGSEESGGCEGLGIIPGAVTQFDTSLGLPVPHIGWNNIAPTRGSALLDGVGDRRVYYVHSYRATPSAANSDWVLATTQYGGEYVAAVNRGSVSAVQFHPEKSGATGLDILAGFLHPEEAVAARHASSSSPSSSSSSSASHGPHGLAKRVIACLDVRSNDQGDLVVTKGDQYDVREKAGGRDVRNLGKPVELAARYFEEGADEVAFLNITGFRDCVMEDTPMLEVLRRASERVFVPLTVGGGIKALTDSSGRSFSAVEVAAEYFRSGADKVSIGSDAVDAAQAYYARGGVPDGSTAIEQISDVYGKQAVVVSIDPRRVYVTDPAAVPHATVRTAKPGPNGEQYCWWQCTVKGGREGRDIGAVELAKAVEALGAGEVLLNCIDNDGVGKGFDLELVDAVSRAVTIPVIASSGAGCPQHFSEVFHSTGAAAALAAGIFHRREVGIEDVKKHLVTENIPTRL
ncbi:Imidazole glycerol phosphate synthase hisHF [Pleodorina starrii]|nr:Imidazole glycerol phosphate synthase hisHF [Pleodorina starrii]GLC75515.1 Imidazole glycerol phosphate synthase hisHF [Pleodorina starrii]